MTQQNYLSQTTFANNQNNLKHNLRFPKLSDNFAQRKVFEEQKDILQTHLFAIFTKNKFTNFIDQISSQAQSIEIRDYQKRQIFSHLKPKTPILFGSPTSPNSCFLFISSNQFFCSFSNSLKNILVNFYFRHQLHRISQITPLFFFILQSTFFFGLFLARFKFDIMDNRRSMQRIPSSKAQNYKYSQIFGYKGPGEKIMEEDIISVLKYDTTGRYLAVGDNAGRVIIFQSDSGKQKDEQLDYLAEFQSHTKEFDPLRSMDIEETITGLSWLRPQGKYLKVVSTNSKNIKLWKIFERAQKKVVRPASKDLNIPKLQTTESYYSSQLSLAFPNKHLSEINSISGSRNEEYLLSSDQVHAYLWSYQKYDKPYIVGDMLGNAKIEDIQENITMSKMHPTADNLLIYGTNKGNLKLCDMRISSNSDSSATYFKNQYPGQKNFLTSFLTSYCSADFCKQGKYLVSRDYLTIKIWDVCNSKKPVNTIVLNEGMKGKLSEVFQNQAIYDKFNVSCSPDGNTIASGTYNNCFHLVDQDGSNMQFQLNYKKTTLSKSIVGKQPPLGKIDYIKKTTALDFHPLRNTVAVASLNCFFLYSM